MIPSTGGKRLDFLRCSFSCDSALNNLLLQIMLLLLPVPPRGRGTAPPCGSKNTTRSKSARTNQEVQKKILPKDDWQLDLNWLQVPAKSWTNIQQLISWAATSSWPTVTENTSVKRVDKGPQTSQKEVFGCKAANKSMWKYVGGGGGGYNIVTVLNKYVKVITDLEKTECNAK